MWIFYATIHNMKRLILAILLLPVLALSYPCSRCGKEETGGTFRLGDRLYCISCFAFASRCGCCGKVISGQGWTIPDGTSFCNECYTTTKEFCDICGAPIGKGLSVALEAGRKMCLKCKETAVTDPKEAVNIYEDIMKYAAKELGLVVKDPVPIKMVLRAEMKNIAKKMKNADRLFGLFVKEGSGRRTLYFLSGTPRYITRGTIAHEFAHAWQDENCVKGQDKRLVEGFCEWVSYKTLYYFGEREAAGIIAAREGDEYGEGYKIFAKLEEKSRPASVVTAVKYMKTLPSK